MSAALAADNFEWSSLYTAVSHMMARLGADGSITTDAPTVEAVMDALHRLDAGQFVPGLTPRAAQPMQAEPATIPRGLIDALRNYRQCDEDGAECIASREAVETAARLLSGFAALVSKTNGEYPECSGNPVSCPENEGYGCCHLTDEHIRQLCPPGNFGWEGKDWFVCGFRAASPRVAQPTRAEMSLDGGKDIPL